MSLQNSPSRHWLGALLVLTLLGGLGALTWHFTRSAADHPPSAAHAGTGPPGPAGRRPPATTVGVATAAYADIPIYIDALGTVTPSAAITVRPQVSGVLTKVLYAEGQMVRAGQVLATIDPRSFELALLQAQGQQQRDEALLEAAEVTLRRYRTLLEQDSIARQEVDTQAASVKQLEGTLMIDKAAVGNAKLNLTYATITAPAGGRIGLRTVDPGNVVSTTDANGIALITQWTPIDVEFALPQDRIADLHLHARPGSPFSVAAFDRARTTTLATGVFLSLNNQSDTETGTVRAKARFSNTNNALFPSQFVNIRLLLDTMRAITVPTSAVRQGPDGTFIYVLTDKQTVTLRHVTTGPSSLERIAVIKGIAEGERVITEGGDRLKDGATAQVAQDAASAGHHRRHDPRAGSQ